MISAARLSELLELPAPTQEQTAVIEAPMSPALVVAGAGSGKTETMAARVLYLVANGLVRPEQILGLTFTRKAASGLAARIRRRLRTLTAVGLALPGGTQLVSGGEPEVSTYHSFGGRLIGEFGPLAGIEPATRVLSATGSWQLARRVVGRWDGDLETDLGPDQVTERLLAMSGGLADHLLDASTLADEIEHVLAQLRAAPPSPAQKGAVHSGLAGYLKRLQDRAWILPLVDAFTEAKRQAGVVDFADQMQVAADLVSAHPRIGQALRDRFGVVLLDEYQDTGHAQRVILRAVFAGTGTDGRDTGHPVTAVGDPVQSIYSWRGASASNLPRFPSDFPRRDGGPATTLTLSTSFRNASAVLGIANRLSAQVRAGAVQVRELSPRPGAAVGEVRYGLFGTAAQEEDWIAAQIALHWQARADGAETATPGIDAPSADAPDTETADTGAAGTPPAATPPPRPRLPGAAPPSTAVLMRRRRDMEPMAMALRAAGLPVEVVGLGGLLNEPEVADLLAMLRVLVDPTAGSAALRLLAGPRWQLGMADLAALSGRASALTPRGHSASVSGPGASTEDGRASVRAALLDAGTGEEIDSASLIDALSDPGPPEQYSYQGFRRLQRLGTELQRLRARLSLPLGDLIAELERTSGLDVEVGISSPAGRAHLDAFADVVADFAAGGGGPTELVEYLLTAAEREDGLTPGEVAPAPGRVQVLTVHAAKGLEWEIVAVPHLSDTVFPGARGSTWLGDAAQLPPSLRGDRADLPQLALPAGGDQKEMVAAVAAHISDLKAEQAIEERRLLYVAVTRAERTLLMSGHQWGRTGSKPHGPSEFLSEIRAAAEPDWMPDEWAPDPTDGQNNPMTAAPRTAHWPPDPLGDRRENIRRGADLVLAAVDRRRAGEPQRGDGQDDRGGGQDDRGGGQDGRGAGPAEQEVGQGFGFEVGPDPQSWSRDVAALLEERRASRSTSIDVSLPQSLSATAMVELAADPSALARRIRRPVPHAPAPRARRGTDFHAWLERFYTGSALLEISELPGAEDNGPAPDAEVEMLKTRFQASEWSLRMPFEVELPFSMTIAGQPVRGRIDAVFRDDDGGCTVVDWKTGHPPSAQRQAPATVQLAVYRLAVSEMLGLELVKVRAAFVYVGTGSTFAPADLLDAAGLAALIVDSTSSNSTSSDSTSSDSTSSGAHRG